jgi:hypothetical protein
MARASLLGSRFDWRHGVVTRLDVSRRCPPGRRASKGTLLLPSGRLVGPSGKRHLPVDVEWLVKEPSRRIIRQIQPRKSCFGI